MSSVELMHEHCQLRSRVVDRSPRSQATHQPERVLVPARPLAQDVHLAKGHARDHVWDPDIVRIAHDGSLKPPRCDSHDGERYAVELERLAEASWIAPETTVPETMAQHDYEVPVGNLVFLGREEAPETGLNPEYREIVRRNHGARDFLGRGAVDAGDPEVTRQTGEHRAVVTVMDVVRVA
jgi:hypothetical protein